MCYQTGRLWREELVLADHLALGTEMKLYLRGPATLAALNEYCAYLEQEEGLQAPVGAIVEGIILYFLDEHPQFRAWSALRLAGSD